MLNEPQFEILGVEKEFVFPEETGDTYLENAMIKAKAVAEFSHTLAIGEDAGLEVEVLPHLLGVKTARVLDGSDQEKMQYVLDQMKNESNRGARFVCVCAIYDPIKNESQSFFGEVRGSIATEMRGSDGFGFDPIFIPKENNSDQKTFAELGSAFKNEISHRARAWGQVKKFLQLQS